MPLQVRNKAGETVALAEQPLARGGEAEVYEVPQYPKAVVKLYHPNVLNKREAALKEKIEVMASDPRLAAFKENKALSWPLFAVYDTEGRWRGYAMRKVDRRAQRRGEAVHRRGQAR